MTLKFSVLVGLYSIEPSMRTGPYMITFDGDEPGSGNHYGVDIETWDEQIIQELERRLKSMSGVMFRLTLEEVKL